MYLFFHLCIHVYIYIHIYIYIFVTKEAHPGSIAPSVPSFSPACRAGIGYREEIWEASTAGKPGKPWKPWWILVETSDLLEITTIYIYIQYIYIYSI